MEVESIYDVSLRAQEEIISLEKNKTIIQYAQTIN